MLTAGSPSGSRAAHGASGISAAVGSAVGGELLGGSLGSGFEAGMAETSRVYRLEMVLAAECAPFLAARGCIEALVEKLGGEAGRWAA